MRKKTHSHSHGNGKHENCSYRLVKLSVNALSVVFNEGVNHVGNHAGGKSHCKRGYKHTDFRPPGGDYARDNLAVGRRIFIERGKPGYNKLHIGDVIYI